MDVEGLIVGEETDKIHPDGVLGEITQQYNQSTMVGLGFPPLNYSDPTLPKCGVSPLCNRTGKLMAIPVLKRIG